MCLDMSGCAKEGTAGPAHDNTSSDWFTTKGRMSSVSLRGFYCHRCVQGLFIDSGLTDGVIRESQPRFQELKLRHVMACPTAGHEMV